LIIAHDELVGTPCLRDDAIELLLKKTLAVICGEGDGNRRHIRSPHNRRGARISLAAIIWAASRSIGSSKMPELRNAEPSMTAI
jgi:hypothetical protein